MLTVAEIDFELKRLTTKHQLAEERRDYVEQLELEASIDTLLEQRTKAEELTHG